ncbi:hypothetical protein [Solimonas soli]|jgi:hypothetical protein|uniref:hypothetical protein n=1 Tax=Solimonas soli TaxID=413479 RepID=UPI000485997A|nr:hypothetical protein [Solimonas soli]
MTMGRRVRIGSFVGDVTGRRNGGGGTAYSRLAHAPTGPRPIERRRQAGARTGETPRPMLPADPSLHA